MKVILTQDVKGKGKRGEVKDLQAGYANFLIKNNQAVIATDNNLEILDEQKKEEAAAAKKLLEEMKELKGQIENHQFVIKVNLAPDGHVLGTITNKHLADLLESELGVKVEKRKITLKDSIKAVGEYHALIQLHHEVTADIKFQVVENH